jgi:hypothetical protein
MPGAATRAAWTRGPRTRVVASRRPSVGQRASDAPSRTRRGDSSHTITGSAAMAGEQGGASILGSDDRRELLYAGPGDGAGGCARGESPRGWRGSRLPFAVRAVGVP